MLLTAMAATVVLVSWVADTTRDRGTAGARPSGGTQLAEQPLVGLGAGVTVREISQATPFSLVALTGDLAGTSTRVRAKRPDGSWGPWYQTEYETAAPDPAPAAGTEEPAGPAPGEATEGPRGTDPLFVGTTTTVQIAVTRPLDAKVTRTPPAPPSAKTDLGYKPASREQP